ncbi:cid1 family poly A polymerase domain-containing protein [Hirsutella rhossiliensis]|uniref:polynucleotide adenylyltransferase n=1 Tax=Hirsutella rhossiliensis TaxID=111463 RepID=A0A9P8MWS7_9HYPO|nr:cid1 family poly A polymerase domain-containing protein [Hirsutella rhossiliensis]KAH0961829.1 cid1 family poly A polymerase domain-containing protein [Hirsutella rhossiliensis]
MDARASTSEPRHSFHSSSWSTAATSAVTSPASLIASDGSPDPVIAPAPAAASLGSHLDFLPFLFPQQSNIYHAQLLHYNKLVSPSRGGGGLQTPPLPPVVSAPHVHAGSRSRSSSKVSLKDAQAGKAAAAGGHGSRSQNNQDKSHPVIASKDPPPRMPAKQLAAESSTSVSQRSTAAATAAASAQGQSHSSSVPSTPHQHARQFSFESRGPSPPVPNSHSPRSAYSETNSTLPSLRPLPPRFGGCKYETAQMNSRRRIPYSVGSDRLEKLDLRNVKSKLSEDEERRLNTDVREIFDRLLPTDAVEANRKKLVGKLERIFNVEWPGHDIRVHLFGSSGNLLCSDDSDVDICITTPWHELEGVCMIANLLARRGMEKVVCISAAKVPIVKIWDPELGLACDMNVNNTLALENTRMVRTYVEADPRVRQLAMIIKYWTRRRIVNDAGLGGTLSSYTWICLIIAFLQVRSPPVLPALHRLPHKLPKPDGTVSDFADNLKKIRGYGSKNKSSVPELLFQFFRFYAHEFDYDKHVLSVRQGKLITKVDKKWNYQLNNQLCVEEPFNVSRNLGNTADEYAFRGLHLELRRAFDLISAAKLSEACEQYVYPKEEERVWTRPAQQSRPVLLRSSSQTHSTHSGRGGRGAYRGGRHNANFHRGGGGGGGAAAGGGSSRRASSSVPTYDNGVFMAPFQYAQQDLMTQMAYQENMRQLQLFAQSPGFLQQSQAMGHQRVPTGTAPGQQPSDRARTNSFDNIPVGTTLRPDLYALYNMSIGHAFYPQVAGVGYGTYPSSPATTGGSGQEFRRSLQRSTVTTDTGASASSSSLRSQSQPASRSPSAAYSQTAYHRGSQTPTSASAYAPKNAHGVPIPSFMPDDADFDETPKAVSESPESSEDDGRSAGFFQARESSLAGHAQPQQQQQPTPPPQGLSNGIAFGDLAAASTGPGRRRLSTDQLPQTILDRRMKRASRSPSPLGHMRAFSVGTPAASLPSAASPSNHGKNSSRPLVVNGSCLKASAVSGQRQASRRESLQPEENLVATADLDQAAWVNGGSDSMSLTAEAPSIPSPGSAAEQLPMVVNGSSTPSVGPPTSDDASFRERVALMAAQHISPKGYQQETTPNGSPARLSPSARQRWMSRQPQNGVIAPLDLAIGDQRANKPTVIDSAHLSPVYEAGASSPNAVRQNDGFWLPAKPDARNEGRPADAEIDEGAPTPTERRIAVYEDDRAQRPEKASVPVSKAMSPRVNGHVRGAKSESDGGWQKAGKGKKKAANAAGQQGHAEQPPKHESERKGG